MDTTYRLILTRAYNDADDDTVRTEDYDTDVNEYTDADVLDVDALTDICRTWIDQRQADDGMLPDGRYAVEVRDIGYALAAQSDGVDVCGGVRKTHD